jgi:hypothetical protein
MKTEASKPWSGFRRAMSSAFLDQPIMSPLQSASGFSLGAAIMRFSVPDSSALPTLSYAPPEYPLR